MLQSFISQFVHTALCTVHHPCHNGRSRKSFSRIEKTVRATHPVMNEEQMEAIGLPQVHRDRTPTIDSILEKSAASGKRHLIL